MLAEKAERSGHGEEVLSVGGGGGLLSSECPWGAVSHWLLGKLESLAREQTLLSSEPMFLAWALEKVCRFN